MIGCFLHFHKMIPTPTKNMNPMIDRQFYVSPIQSTSQNHLKAIFFLPRHKGVRMLRHTILLRSIRGAHFLLDTTILWKMVECFINELHVVVRLKCLDFAILLRLYEHLEVLKLLETLPFGFQRIHSHLPKRNHQWRIQITLHRS